MDLKGQKFFRVYQDSDVLQGLTNLVKDGRENLIDSTQDDDVESDEEVTRNGIQTSFKDLLVVKDYLAKNQPEKIR